MTRIEASVTTEKFRQAFRELPPEIQQRAKRAFQIWKQHPESKGLRFKQVHLSRPIYSVRIGSAWRALGVLEGGTMVWFWIGSHADYDKLLKKL